MCTVLRATITTAHSEAIERVEAEQWLQLPNEKRPPLWDWQAERRKAQRLQT
jgi:hypothetical protein